MRKLFLVLLLLSLFPLSALAIGEVTPTPIPAGVPTQAPTLAPTALPTQVPTVAPTAIIPQTEDGDVRAILDSALADLQAQQWLGAIEKAEQVLALDSTNDEAYLVRAVAQFQLGRAENAVEDISLAIQYAPYNYIYFQLRADIHLQMGNEIDALSDYDSAIAINPLNEEAFRNRAQVNYQLSDNVAGDADDFIARALARYGTGDFRGAIEFANTAVESAGTRPVAANAYYIIAISQSNLNNDAGALEAYDNAIEANPDMHVLYLARGIQHREAGDLQAAGADFYRRISILGQDNVDATMTLGESRNFMMSYRRVYRITFTGEAGQSVTISARDTGGTEIDPLISLLDPNGTPIAGDDDFGGALNAQIDNFELPVSGTYTLLLGHAEGGYDAGFEGLVSVQLGR